MAAGSGQVKQHAEGVQPQQESSNRSCAASESASQQEQAQHCSGLMQHSSRQQPGIGHSLDQLKQEHANGISVSISAGSISQQEQAQDSARPTQYVNRQQAHIGHEAGRRQLDDRDGVTPADSVDKQRQPQHGAGPTQHVNRQQARSGHEEGQRRLDNMDGTTPADHTGKQKQLQHGAGPAKGLNHLRASNGNSPGRQEHAAEHRGLAKPGGHQTQTQHHAAPVLDHWKAGNGHGRGQQEHDDANGVPAGSISQSQQARHGTRLTQHVHHQQTVPRHEIQQQYHGDQSQQHAVGRCRNDSARRKAQTKQEQPAAAAPKAKRAQRSRQNPGCEGTGVQSQMGGAQCQARGEPDFHQPGYTQPTHLPSMACTILQSHEYTSLSSVVNDSCPECESNRSIMVMFHAKLRVI